MSFHRKLKRQIARRLNEQAQQVASALVRAQGADWRERQWQAQFDDAEIHNGIHRFNEYTCEKCGFIVRTVDRAKGITPFMILCKAPEGCDGMATSAFYRVPIISRLPVTWEWYRPMLKELGTFDPGTREHVEQGGLLLRRITLEESETL